MRPKLDHFLEVAYGQYARAELIASDPLQVPYRHIAERLTGWRRRRDQGGDET
jgi:hypothetical protein